MIFKHIYTLAFIAAFLAPSYASADYFNNEADWQQYVNVNARAPADVEFPTYDVWEVQRGAHVYHERPVTVITKVQETIVAPTPQTPYPVIQDDNIHLYQMDGMNK